MCPSAGRSDEEQLVLNHTNEAWLLRVTEWRPALEARGLPCPSAENTAKTATGPRSQGEGWSEGPAYSELSEQRPGCGGEAREAEQPSGPAAACAKALGQRELQCV